MMEEYKEGQFRMDFENTEGLTAKEGFSWTLKPQACADQQTELSKSARSKSMMLSMRLIAFMHSLTRSEKSLGLSRAFMV